MIELFELKAGGTDTAPYTTLLTETGSSTSMYDSASMLFNTAACPDKSTLQNMRCPTILLTRILLSTSTKEAANAG